VIEGDQETERDAARIRAAGAAARQINTGARCHLDAHAVGHAMRELDVRAGTVLFIENVGNLVCPALFDLGERARVVIVSVTEGDDKPEKYPHMFRAATLMVVSKIDLLPYVAFDIDACVRRARAVNPAIEALPVSAKDGAGMGDWIGWIERARSRP
jgi:hydrogenase nickel incorporation protein HypB